MQQRRKNVRVRPTADFNIGIDYGAGFIKVRLEVIDVAVGGVGLVISEQLLGVAAGSDIKLGVTLPGAARFETLCSLRYTQGKIGGRCGVHFNHLTPEQQAALSRAVSELLERGASA